MTGRSMRLWRGWAAACAATFLAALSHTVSGANAPDPAVLGLSLALSGLVCTALAGRVLSLWRLCAAVVLSQGLFHALFSLNPAPHTTRLPGHLSHSGHLNHVMVLDPATTGAVMDHASPMMWAGHALAAVLTIAVLRQGEVTALRLLAALGLRLVPFLPLIQPLAIETNAPYRPTDWRIRPMPNLGAPLLVMRHRGPPALASVSEAHRAFITV